MRLGLHSKVVSLVFLQYSVSGSQSLSSHGLTVDVKQGGLNEQVEMECKTNTSFTLGVILTLLRLRCLRFFSVFALGFLAELPIRQCCICALNDHLTVVSWSWCVRG